MARKTKSTAEAVTEIEDEQIKEAMSGSEAANNMVTSLLQQFITDPTGISKEHMDMLQTTGLLDKVSEQIEKVKQKIISPEEINELRLVAHTTAKFKENLADLELQKYTFIEQIHVLDEKKADFLNYIGNKYRVPQGSKWVVDLDTGVIRITGSNTG
jgi:beta-N-acetylglucosaminidase